MVETEILPPVDIVAAETVLSQVDELLDWKKNAEDKAQRAGVRLARRLAIVAENTYWIARGCKGEEEYIEKCFPQSRPQYYRLKTIGSVLMPYPEQLLESIGVSKCYDLVRIHRHCGGVIPNNFFVHAKEETRDDFRKRVRVYIGRILPAPNAGDDEYVLYTYKVWKSALPVVNKAFEMAALESGSNNKSNNFINICAEFCAGHNEEGNRLGGQNQILINYIGAFIEMLDPRRDPSCQDRTLGRIRKGFEKLKELYG